MDTGIIFALVLATLFIGAILWLIIYSHRHGDERADSSLKPRETESKKRAA